MAFRVPTPDVSVVDLTARLEKPVKNTIAAIFVENCNLKFAFVLGNLRPN